MAQFLAPIVNNQQEDNNGAPLSGGTIEVYLAGTSTPAATTSDKAGLVPNTNPIVLNVLGVNSQGSVWITGGASYKFVIKNSVGVVQRTIDNVSGINDSTIAVDQWIVYQGAPTYVSATSFTLAGDQTLTFSINRRIRTQNTGGVIYSTIKSSVYSNPNTTITVANDSGVLDAGVSQVSYGIISVLDSSILPLGNYSGRTLVATNTALTVANIGQIVSIGATGLTMTLPLASAVPAGATFTFQSQVKFTITRSGSDQIFGPAGLVTSINLFGNCSITATGTSWVIELGGNAVTAATVGRYQTPEGILHQWGSSTVTLNGSSVGNIVFPVTFGAIYSVVICNGDTTATPINCGLNSYNVSGFNAFFSGAGAIGVRINWFAFGLAA